MHWARNSRKAAIQLIYKEKPEMRTSRLCYPIRKQHALLVKLLYADISFFAQHILLAKFLDLDNACTCHNF